MTLTTKKEEFLQGAPFPHIVLDEFLDEDYFSSLNSVLEKMKNDVSGKHFATDVEKNKWISLNTSLPDVIKNIVDTLNADSWVGNMRELTGITSLVSTRYGNTKLANYHEMKPGGVLGSHVDHSFEPETGLPHVLNILIYLSENWDVSSGGATLFFDKYGNKVINKVEYKNNRAIIFLHTPYSFHGVEKIKNDCDKKRRTIYVDYYSQSYDPYVNIPLSFDKKWFKHGTMFKLDSILDYFRPKNKHYMKSFLQYHMNKCARKICKP